MLSRSLSRSTTGGENNPVSLFFAPVIGDSTQNVTATAIAGVKRLDVVFAQDVSSSYSADLAEAVTGTQDALSYINTTAPPIRISVWFSTVVGAVPGVPYSRLRANYTSLNTTIGKLTNCASASGSAPYNVYGGTTTSIAVTTKTPACCGSDLATGLQQAINMFTSSAYTSTVPPGTRQAIIVSSDGESNASSNGQHSTPTWNDTTLNALATSTAETAWTKYGISVFVLLYYHGSDTSDDITLLKSLVQGDGTYTQVTSAAQVPTALSAIIQNGLTYGLVK